MNDTQIKAAIAALSATRKLQNSGMAANLALEFQSFTTLTGNLGTPLSTLNRAKYSGLKSGVLEKSVGVNPGTGRAVPTYRATAVFQECEAFLGKFGHIPNAVQITLLEYLCKVYANGFWLTNEIVKETGLAKHAVLIAGGSLFKAEIVWRKAGSGYWWEISGRGFEFLRAFKELCGIFC